jgi:hypothetical protein
MTLLSRGQPPVDVRQPEIVLQVGQRAIERDAVDLVLPVRQVTFDVSGRPGAIRCGHRVH